jgi:hypothetical protein
VLLHRQLRGLGAVQNLVHICERCAFAHTVCQIISYPESLWRGR